MVNPARLPAPGPRRVRGTERGFRPALPVGEGGRLPAPEPGPHLDDDSSKTVLACCLHRHAHGCACVYACACVCVLDGRERGAMGAGARVFQVPTSFLDLSFLTRRRGGWKTPAGPPPPPRGVPSSPGRRPRGRVLPPGGGNVRGTAPHRGGRASAPCATATTADKHRDSAGLGGVPAHWLPPISWAALCVDFVATRPDTPPLRLVRPEQATCVSRSRDSPKNRARLSPGARCGDSR